MIHRHKDLKDQFFAKTTNINLVLNDDPLSQAEAVRIQQKLRDIGVKIAGIILNKAKENKVSGDMANAFNEYPIKRFPKSYRNLYGIDALKAYILENNDI